MFFVDQQKENPLLIYFWSLIVRAHHLRYFKTNQTHTNTHMRFNFSLSSFWSHQLRSNVRRFIEKVMAWQFLFDPRPYSRAFGVCSCGQRTSSAVVFCHATDSEWGEITMRTDFTDIYLQLGINLLSLSNFSARRNARVHNESG